MPPITARSCLATTSRQHSRAPPNFNSAWICVNPLQVPVATSNLLRDGINLNLARSAQVGTSARAMKVAPAGSYEAQARSNISIPPSNGITNPYGLFFCRFISNQSVLSSLDTQFYSSKFSSATICQMPLQVPCPTGVSIPVGACFTKRHKLKIASQHALDQRSLSYGFAVGRTSDPYM